MTVKQFVKITNYRIEIGEIVLYFDVEFSLRRTMAIYLKIQSGQILMVIKAPNGVNIKEVEKFILRKQKWILKHRKQLETLLTSRSFKSYEDGSQHLLLNEPLELKIILALFNRVERKGKLLCVYTQNKDQVTIKKLVKEWYAQQIPLYMIPIIQPIINSFCYRYKVHYNRLEFKYVHSYWGVCTGKGVIRLNIELLRAPRECIEYIITHELCHLVHHNHSARFYHLLSQEMPDWKQRKELLYRSISCRE